MTRAVHHRESRSTELQRISLGPARRDVIRAGALTAGASCGRLSLRRCVDISVSSPCERLKMNDDAELTWLVVDHHVHSIYSHDAKYTMDMILDRAQQFGVDAIAYTEHANLGRAHQGGVWEANREVRRARENRDMLVFQGLEWYIPAAEHGTVLVAPGPNEARLLRTFELLYDGKLNGWEKPIPGSAQVAEWEGYANEAIAWLGERKAAGFIDDVLVLANHPSRLGMNFAT